MEKKAVKNDHPAEEQLLLRLAKLHIAPNYAPYPVVVRQAHGCWVNDVRGETYLDMLSCYSALNFGHRHPVIMDYVREQLENVTVVPGCFMSEEKILFAKELSEFCGMEMVLLMNTGAEAVETAIKLARKWAYTRKQVPVNKAEIIVCGNNFHGRTTTIVSFSTEPQYKDLFGPHTPGFVVVPFGDAEALERAITPNTAGFLVEPIQGEGGIIVPPDDYLRVCRDICTDYNVLFMADEIQTGLARTGRMFACDWENVHPDVRILGKALGGGIMPVSAVVASRALLETFVPGDHGSTFGGSPLACHVGRGALFVLKSEHLAERAELMGKYFSEALRSMNSSYVKEVRGKGLLIGVELVEGTPGAHKLCGDLIGTGVLCKEADEKVIRFAPPLIIEKREIDWAMERIRAVFAG